jgi:2-polyprenyl-3-methyl-5-hydroxy-6-metoxy-1,4-benzoquinol methylase
MVEQVKQDGYLISRIRMIFQPGLGMKQRIRLIPVIGYLIAWVNALCRLPITRHHTAVELAQLQEELGRTNQALANHIADMRLEECVAQLAERIAQLEGLKLSIRLERYDALDIGKRLMQFDQLQLARQMKSINLLMRTHQLRETAMLDRIDQLEQGSESGNTQASATRMPTQVTSLVAEPQMRSENDRFYVEFEALFRGNRADIKQRLQVYLPYLSHIFGQPKSDRLMVIDVGCGRGEWLELLDEQGIPAMGVDLNAAMVDACLQQGFLARCADAIQTLREQVPGSIGAVTGFHIIEHLPFEQLLALFDAAQQALCPGGVIIFETPNPENLKVGACNFYFDPTHLHPIVPQVAEFIARQRGFSEAEILRLHPYPDDHLLHGGSAVEAVINKELFGPQDYAVIGKK